MDPGSLGMMLRLPYPWPPNKVIEVISIKSGPAARVLINQRGQIVLCIPQQGQEDIVVYSQPLDVRGSGLAILSIRWSDELVDFRINEKPIPIASGSDEIIIVDTVEATESEIYTPLYQGIDPRFGKTENEQLFLHTLIDIEAKYLSQIPYQLIRSSAMLRQLFLDESPLVYQVNRNYSIRLQFYSGTYQTSPPDIEIENIYYWLTPEIGFGRRDPPPLVNLEKFLKSPCLLNGTTYVASVADVIKICANVMGGVHLGSPKSEVDKALMHLDDSSIAFGSKPSLVTISGIIRVSLHALKPLVDAMLASEQP